MKLRTSTLIVASGSLIAAATFSSACTDSSCTGVCAEGATGAGAGGATAGSSGNAGTSATGKGGANTGGSSAGTSAAGGTSSAGTSGAGTGGTDATGGTSSAGTSSMGGMGGTGTAGTSATGGSAGKGATGGTAGTGGAAGKSGAAGSGQAGAGGGAAGAPACDATLGQTCCAGDTCGTTEGMVCDTGVCKCDLGFTDCDAKPENGCEASLLSDSKNCGACGHDCAGATCAGGICEVQIVAPAAELGVYAGPTAQPGRYLNAVSGDSFYWFNAAGQLARWPVTGGASVVLVTAAETFFHPPQVVGSSVFWTDGSDAKVRRAPKAGGTAVDVASYPGTIFSLQPVDTGDVYFLESSGAHSLQRIKAGTATAEVVIANPQAAGLDAYFRVDGMDAWCPGYPTGLTRVPLGGGATETIDANVLAVAAAEPRAALTATDVWVVSGSKALPSAVILRCPRTTGPCSAFVSSTTAPAFKPVYDIVVTATTVYALVVDGIFEIPMDTGVPKRLTSKPSTVPLLQQDSTHLYFFGPTGDFLRLAK